MLDRLLEMVRERGGVAADRSEIGDRKAERDESKIAREGVKETKEGRIGHLSAQARCLARIVY